MRDKERYQYKLTNFEAFANSFKALVGIGILSVPYSFKDVGIIGGVIGIIFSVLLCNYTCRQLIRVIDTL
jgi:amino acid permease